MKKISSLSFILLILLSMNKGFSQQNPQELKNKIAELEKKIAEKKSVIKQKDFEIKSLVKENNYYKESLKLINSRPINEKNGFEFKITSAKGDLNSGKIILEVLVENKGLPADFQPNKSDITDPKGNNYSSFNHKLGKFSSIEKLQKNVPTKMTIEFDKVREQIPMIKSLNLFVYDPNRLGRKFNLTFSNIPVSWENFKTEKKNVKKTKMKVW